MKKGFTLIEILVVVGILGLIAVIGTNMFFSILKGETKTRVLAEVKQNGNYALSVMGRMIRNAKEITSCTSNMQTITIKNPDREETTFDLSGTRIASRSALGTGYLTSDKVRIDKTDPVNKPYRFDCTAVTGSPAVITIRFTLSQPGVATRPEEQATVDFKTTVSLRTY